MLFDTMLHIPLLLVPCAAYMCEFVVVECGIRREFNFVEVSLSLNTAS
jgi:hypothetical protein